MTETWSKI